jgi:hypothetical protein
VGFLNRELRCYLVTTDEAARLADVSVAVIHQWSSRGFLNRYGARHSALWDWRELEAVKHAPRGTRRRVAA